MLYSRREDESIVKVKEYPPLCAANMLHNYPLPNDQACELLGQAYIAP